MSTTNKARIETLVGSDESTSIYPRTLVDAILGSNGKKATVICADETGKIPNQYLPNISVDSDHFDNTDNPHNVTLSQLGVTATASELNKMDGVTATTSEINYLKGVNSKIQDQINNLKEDVTSNTESIDMNKMAILLNSEPVLKWDGSKEGRQYFEVSRDESMSVRLVHVTDEVPVILDPDSVLYMFTSAEGGFEVNVTSLRYQDGVYVDDNEDGIFIVPNDMSMNGMTFKKGVYLMAMYYNINGIDMVAACISNLYIIGHSFGGNELLEYNSGGDGGTTTNELTWDGNIADRSVVTISDNTILVKMSDIAPDVSVFESGYTIGFFENGTNQIVEFSEQDGVPITSIGIGYWLGEMNVLVLNTPLVEDGISIDSGLYFICSAGEDGSIASYTSYLSAPNLQLVIGGSAPGYYIKNKYYNFMEYKTIKGPVTNELTWDGNIDNRTCISSTINEDSINATIKFVKMSSSVPDISVFESGYDINSYIYYRDSNEQIEQDMPQSFPDSNGELGIDASIDGLYILNAQSVVIVTIAGTSINLDVMNITFPETGIYFADINMALTDDSSSQKMYVKSLTAPNLQVQPESVGYFIKEEYLPAGFGGGSSSGGTATDTRLPEVTSANNGDFLRVVNGAWAAVTLPNAEEGEF